MEFGAGDSFGLEMSTLCPDQRPSLAGRRQEGLTSWALSWLTFTSAADEGSDLGRERFSREGKRKGLTLSGETGRDDGQRSVQVEHDQPGPLEVGVRIGRGCGGSGHGVVDVVRKCVEVASDV